MLACTAVSAGKKIPQYKRPDRRGIEMRLVLEGHPGPSRIDVNPRRTRASEMLGLARAPVVAFELYRHVTDVELPLEHHRHLRQHAVLIGLACDHRVRRKRELAAGEAPYVKIVDF